MASKKIQQLNPSEDDLEVQSKGDSISPYDDSLDLFGDVQLDDMLQFDWDIGNDPDALLNGDVIKEELADVTSDASDHEEPEPEECETKVTRRGRKPGKKGNGADNAEFKLEKSRQSAKECRARKKLRYQNLDTEINVRELEIIELRKEFDQMWRWMQQLKNGEKLSPSLIQFKNDNKELIDQAAARMLSQIKDANHPSSTK